METINRYIDRFNKEELFIVGFYISIILIMLTGVFLDFWIDNYIDMYFELLFATITLLGLIYFYYTHNVWIAKHFIVLVSVIGSYIFLITSGFVISVFTSIVSLSFFLLFSIRRSLVYNLIHQLTIATIYIYGYSIEPNNPILKDWSIIFSTFIASLLMILLGIVYQLSIENSYKKLYKSNQEKELLLQELNHRVKNNLQIILSIIQLQSLQSREKDKFLELENRINAISNSYELLTIGSNLEKINMKDYIERLLLNIQGGFAIENKNISVKIETHIFLALKEATYIGLIVNELVTNSYKYAFENIKNGLIEIVFEKKDNRYILIIKDNGKGFDMNKKKKSLGLELVYSLINEQLKGSIHCDSKNRTKYTIEFTI
jgi:two-component sensor histidine kinase